MEQLIQQKKADKVDAIKFYMATAGMTYDEAKAVVKESCCLGSRIWAEIDAEFNQ